MPNAQQIIERVQRKVRDASYGPDEILEILNEGIQEIAGWKNSRPEMGLMGDILLPALETSDTVTTATDSAMVALPDDFAKNLFHVSQVGPAINIYSSVAQLLAEWDGVLTNTGTAVEDVTVQGANLVYQPIPTTAIELTLRYHRKPDVLTLEDASGITNVPSCLPEQLHYDLLVNYAAKEIYDEIEDGLDGQAVQTAKYTARYQQALNRLHKSITHTSRQRLTRNRAKGWF